jgi:hypothetical protein
MPIDAMGEIRFQHEIEANAFFHDFLLFLQEAGREPFRLTEKGNLRLGDIVPFRQPCLTSRLLYDYAALFCNCNSTNVIDLL